MSTLKRGRPPDGQTKKDSTKSTPMDSIESSKQISRSVDAVQSSADQLFTSKPQVRKGIESTAISNESQRDSIAPRVKETPMGNNKPNKKSPETEPQNEKTNGAFYGNSQGAANINREPPDGPANDDYEREEPPPGKVWVYSPYIVRYGRRIFRKDGKMWRFPGDPDYQRS